MYFSELLARVKGLKYQRASVVHLDDSAPALVKVAAEYPNKKVSRYEKPKQSLAATNGVAVQTLKQRHNKALHPTAYAPFVPHFAPAAGELGR